MRDGLFVYQQQFNMPCDVQLLLSIHGSWHSVLTIPVGDFHLFTTCPLKWLMFLGYTIYGRQGILKAEAEGPELDDYTIDVGSLNDRYFYVAQCKSQAFESLTFYNLGGTGEPRLIDVGVVEESVVTESTTTFSTHSSQAPFKSAVIARDGSCVFSNFCATDCDAARCLPYSKGDEVCSSLSPDLDPFLKYPF